MATKPYRENMYSQDNTFALSSLLIIDDTEIDRFVAERLVIKQSFAREVTTRDSGINALSYIQSLIELGKDLPQLIFLDINMPGMNGFEFLDEFSALPETATRNTRIVMLTSSLIQHEKEMAEQHCHVKLFVNKPLSPQKMDEIKGIFG